MNRLISCSAHNHHNHIYLYLLIFFFVFIRSTSAQVWIFDPFNYAKGSLTSVALWSRSSGVEGEIEVIDQSIRLDETKSEDVFIELAGGGVVETMLYAGFDLVIEGVPTGEGNYFAHFRGGSTTTFRGRIFLIPSEESGKVKLGISNGANGAEAIVHDHLLEIDRKYHIVLSYDPEIAETRLWIDPSDEGSDFVIASDSSLPRDITAFAFRQSLIGGNGMGMIMIDNLIVASNFESIIEQSSINPPTEPDEPIVMISVSPTADLKIAEGGAALEIEFHASEIEREVEISIMTMGEFSDLSDVILSATDLKISPEHPIATFSIQAVNDDEIELEETIMITFQTEDHAVIFEEKSLQLLILDDDRGGLLFTESFSYPDSPLTQNAKWQTHSGLEESTRVEDQSLILTDASTEDFHILIPGFPFEANEELTLYAAFDLTILKTSEAEGTYFAHFKGATINAFRARIYIETIETNETDEAETNEAEAIRIGLLSGSLGLPIYSDAFLEKASPHRIVLGYELSSGTASLWIDPDHSEDAPLISKSESSLIDIYAFAFRQTGSESGGLGEIEIDNLMIGTSFESVSQSAKSLPEVHIQTTHSPATEEGIISAAWEISRSGDLSQSLKIGLDLSGTATFREDFHLIFDPKEVEFESGIERIALNLFPLDDEIDEPDEWAILTIIPSSNYELGDADSATITLIDNDELDPELHITKGILRIITPFGVRFELERSEDLIHWERFEEIVGEGMEMQFPIEIEGARAGFFRLKRISN